MFVIPPDVNGPHCTPVSHALLGQAKAIALNFMLAPGMLVKLTANICTDHGLVNNARGRVIDVVYPPTPNDVAVKKSAASERDFLCVSPKQTLHIVSKVHR